MKFLGKAVEHAIYGKGIITNHESKYVTIKFDAMTDLKEFPYPSCFKSNLKILDDNIAQSDESCTITIEKHRILFSIGIDALNTTRKPLNYRPIIYHGDESCTITIEKHRILFNTRS